MATKMIRDPEALEAELNEAHRRNRELDRQVNAIGKERKEFQRGEAERAEAVKAKEEAEAALSDARQRIDALEKELESEKSARAAERNLVANAKALKRAFEAL